MIKAALRVAVAALVCAGCLSGGRATAAEGGEYAEWELSGRTVEVPAVGFPAGTFSSDSSRVQVPSGASAFHNEATPFGAEFGSSRNQGYLTFGTSPGGSPSVTTVTFEEPATPGEWGFALGDIDADTVRITATGAGGQALTPAQLGFEGVYNFCTGSPKPGSCGSGTQTDQPTWNAATGELVGNVVDTTGASGWFRPTVPVKSVTFTFTVLSGIPLGQLWIAAKWSDRKPDIVMTKTAAPRKVKPGEKIKFRIEVKNRGTARESHAEYTDDLSDVLDDATYNGDASADGGTVTYRRPKLTWEGELAAGEKRTLTYSVTVNRPVKGNKKIINVLVGDGPRMACAGGECEVEVEIRKIRPHGKDKHRKPGSATGFKSRKYPRDACRTADARPSC